MCWRYLSSRSVSRQVFSAQMSLTSVFGMGTGGPSPQSTPTYFFLKEKVSKKNFNGGWGRNQVILFRIEFGLVTTCVFLYDILHLSLRKGIHSSQRTWSISSLFSLASSSRNRFESLHPQNRTKRTKVIGTSACIFLYSNLSSLGQALGILVPVSCIHYCTSTSGLSTT